MPNFHSLGLNAHKDQGNFKGARKSLNSFENFYFFGKQTGMESFQNFRPYIHKNEWRNFKTPHVMWSYNGYENI